MTAPAGPAPDPDVRAVAFLLTRDRRSVLDRHKFPMEPDKAFLGDPDGLLQAGRRLHQAGFHLDAWDRVSVTFRGPAALFETRLKVRIDGAGGPQPRITLAGGSWATGFDVDRGTLLDAVVARVILVPMDSPQPTGRELFVPDREGVYYHDDVIVGDTVSALRRSTPQPPADFPPAGPEAALAINRATQEEWTRSLRRERIELAVNSAEDAQFLVGEVTGGPPIAVQAMIVEGHFPPQIEEGFRALALADDDDAERPELTPQLTIDRWGTDPGAIHRNWYHNAADRPAADGFRRGGPIRAAIAAHRSARTTGEAATTLGALLTATTDVPPGDAAAAGWLPGVRATLATGVQEMAAGSPEQAREVWDRLLVPWTRFDRWLNARWSYYDGVYAEALQAARRHGTMSALPFLSVVINMVTVELCERPDPRDTIWTCDPPGDDATRTVVSCSFGSSAYGGFGAADLVTRLAARLPRLAAAADRVLYVLPVGNTANAGPEDVPDEQCALAGLPNVLIVGGAARRQGAWAANPNTHGYQATVPRDGGTIGVTVPDVCALTLSYQGGSVFYPTVPDRPRRGDDGVRWWLGGGSSLSTPMVASICALVWARHPGLSAADVKQVVIDGAVPLTGGAFHVPGTANAGLTAFASPAGPLRATLDGALDEADRRWPARAAAPPPAMQHVPASP